MTGFGDIVTEVGGAVGALFASKGNAAEANSYTGAAQLETQNAQLTAASTRIQETQIARSVTQSLGATQADVAGAGFTLSGSALDILRSGAQQGSLAKSLVNIQGAINENAYAAEAGADLAKAKAAKEANSASMISSIASVGGALIDNAGDLASAGKTLTSGYNTISGWLSGGTALQTTGPLAVTGDGTALSSAVLGTGGTGEIGSGLAADFGGGLQSATDLSISSGAEFGNLVADTSIGVDTSAGSILGASADAVTTGIGDFLSGAALDVGAGTADAAASAAAIAAGIGDAVATAGSFLADAAIAALAC